MTGFTFLRAALVLLLPVPAALAQTPRLGEVTPVSADAFNFGPESGGTLFSAGEVRGRTVGRVKVNGTVYTLSRVRRTQSGDWTTSTFAPTSRAFTVEVRYRWTSAMGGETDCAHGNGTLTVRRGRKQTQRQVAVIACPEDLFQ